MYCNDPAVVSVARTVAGSGVRQVTYELTDTVTLHSRYWSGGTKHHYYRRSIAVSPSGTIKFPETQKTEDYKLSPGEVVVLCADVGTKQYVTVYCHPDTPIAKMPANQVTLQGLTTHLKLVLWSTRNNKSSYAGISNYRYYCVRSYITQSEWDAARSALIKVGLLDGRGALTTAGKNLADELGHTVTSIVG